MRGRSRGREQRRCYFRDDTGHRLKGVQRLQHTFRALLALLSGHCTGVVGRACEAGVGSLCHTHRGVWQGSCEGPISFLFIVQAAMETLTWPVAKPAFRTR